MFVCADIEMYACMYVCVDSSHTHTREWVGVSVQCSDVEEGEGGRVALINIITHRVKHDVFNSRITKLINSDQFTSAAKVLTD